MNQLQSIAISSILKLLALIPLKWLTPIANLLGWMLWVSNNRSKSVTEANLRVCFPEKSNHERAHIAKQRMKHLCMTALELGAIWSWPTAKLLTHMDLPSSQTLLDEKVEQKKGVILLVPHHGNWEALGPYVGSKHPLVCMYQPPKIEALDSIILKSRSRFSAELAPTNAGGVRTLLKSLKRGDVIAILPDQVPSSSGGGDYASFFGTPAFTMTLVHSLIQRTKAPVLLGYAKRIDNSKHFKPVFREVPAAIYSSNQQESIQALNTAIEQAVLECPEQYQWEYKRFKKQADGNKFYG